MWSKKRSILILCHSAVFLTLLVAGPALAHAHEWRNISADDLKFFVDPKTDLDFRIRLIRSAQKTIDLASYDLRADEEFSMPVLSALREAAERGVHVRLLASWIPQFVYDVKGRALEFLQTPPASTPIQVSVFGGPDLRGGILNVGDGMHEKLMIVDGKVVVTSGRGLGDQYLQWMDTTFVLKGSWVQDSAEVFNDLWNVIQKWNLGRPFIRMRWRVTGVRKSYDVPPGSRPDPKQSEYSQELLSWSLQPSHLPPTLQARVLHHDFIQQLMSHFKNPSQAAVKERLAQIEDPILDEAIERIQSATDIRLYMLSTLSHPKLKAALLQAAKKPGTKIAILTNGQTPVEVAASPWVVSLPDLDDYLRAGIKVYAFKKSPNRPWTFSHRKLAVMDQTVFFGSHNLNLPSTAFNDELSFEVVDPSLAEEWRANFDEDVRVNGQLLEADKVHAARIDLLNQLSRRLLWPLLGIM